MNKFIIIMTTALVLSQSAIASASPSIEHTRYEENRVYHLTGYFAYSTAIEFGDDEHVETISLGDSKSWQVIKPARANVVFIKPILENDGTNMTILTDKHIYSFMLQAMSLQETSADTPILRYEFTYRDVNLPFPGKPANAQPSPATIGQERPTQNFHYSYAGSNALKPIHAFDDGTFTYLLFDEHQKLPAIFAVDDDRSERLVNFRIEEPYLVIDSIEKQFTLRDGDLATCIFNEDYRGDDRIQNELTPVNNGALPKPAHKPSYLKHRLLTFFSGTSENSSTPYNN